LPLPSSWTELNLTSILHPQTIWNQEGKLWTSDYHLISLVFTVCKKLFGEYFTLFYKMLKEQPTSANLFMMIVLYASAIRHRILLKHCKISYHILSVVPFVRFSQYGTMLYTQCYRTIVAWISFNQFLKSGQLFGQFMYAMSKFFVHNDSLLTFK